MRKFALTLIMVAAVAMLLPGAAFGTTFIDPNIGFCPVPASASACQGQPDTNPISSGTSFGMWSFGSNDATTPWYLLVAVPEGPAAVQPVITSGSFTLSFVTSKTFTTGDIYSLFGLTGNNSMNATNMFGSQEAAAFGGTPTDFKVYEFQVTPGFNGGTAYSFTVGGAGLRAGTFLAAEGLGPAGCDPNATSGNNQCNIQFSTPYTTAGLITGGHQPPPSVPEPASMALFGTGLVGIAGVMRRRMK